MTNYDGTEAFEVDNKLDTTALWHGTALPVGAANQIPQYGIFLLVDSLSVPTTMSFHLQTSATLSSPNFKELPSAVPLSHKFTAVETWSPISGLSAESIKVIHVNTAALTGGVIAVEVDSVEVLEVSHGVANTSLVLSPSVKVDVKSKTNPYDITSAAINQNLSISAKEIQGEDLFFKPDGTELYIFGNNSDKVHQYTLSTAWDLSTATFTRSYDTSFRTNSGAGLFFKEDGLKMYILGNAEDAFYQFTLSTAWDISTSVFAGSYDVTVQDTNPHSCFFKPDGTKFYHTGATNDKIYEYDLSTAWLVTSSTFNQSLDVSGKDLLPHGVHFTSNGLKMYVIGSTNDKIYEYDLSTAWDISTATFLREFDVSTEETQPNGVFLTADGFKLYLIGEISDKVHEYDVGAFTGTARTIII